MYYRVLQSIKKTNTNLAHLLRPIFEFVQSSLILQICTCCFWVPRCFVVLSIFCLVEVAGIFNCFIVKNSISKVSLTFLRWRSRRQTSRIDEDYEICPIMGSKIGRGSKQFPRNFELHPPRVGSFCKHNSR